MKVKFIAIKALAASILVCALVAMLLCYDAVKEQHFVLQSIRLVGESEREIANQFPGMFTRTKDVVNIHRRRVYSYLWRMLGRDESVSVYVVVSEGSIGQCVFAVWFPSMRTVEYTK